jgi:hypothetical protein
MTKKTGLIAVTGAVLLTGCQHGARGQALDNQTALSVRVEGNALASLQRRTADGETIHRVVESSDRKEVLFAYDIDVKKGAAPGGWKFLLKPSVQKPTFEKAREVAVDSADDVVRVELLEQPETGEKVVDVFELQTVTQVNVAHPRAHLVKFHQMVYNFLHGNQR